MRHLVTRFPPYFTLVQSITSNFFSFFYLKTTQENNHFSHENRVHHLQAPPTLHFHLRKKTKNTLISGPRIPWPIVLRNCWIAAFKQAGRKVKLTAPIRLRQDPQEAIVSSGRSFWCMGHEMATFILQPHKRDSVPTVMTSGDGGIRERWVYFGKSGMSTKWYGKVPYVIFIYLYLPIYLFIEKKTTT